MKVGFELFQSDDWSSSIPLPQEGIKKHEYARLKSPPLAATTF
jgi:hypothetical protein